MVAPGGYLETRIWANSWGVEPGQRSGPLHQPGQLLGQGSVGTSCQDSRPWSRPKWRTVRRAVRPCMVMMWNSIASNGERLLLLAGVIKSGVYQTAR